MRYLIQLVELLPLFQCAASSDRGDVQHAVTKFDERPSENITNYNLVSTQHPPDLLFLLSPLKIYIDNEIMTVCTSS